MNLPTPLSPPPYHLVKPNQPVEVTPVDQIALDNKKEMAKRGMSMPNINVPDDIRARHMTRTKHAVVLRQDQPFTVLRDQPSDHIMQPGDRTARAMTFDSPYSAFLPASHSIFDPHARLPAIPITHRVRRAGSSPAEPPPHIISGPHIISKPPDKSLTLTVPLPDKPTIAGPLPSSLRNTAPAPDLPDLRSIYQNSRPVKKSNRNIIINTIPTILNPSSSSSSIMSEDTEDKYASEMEEMPSFRIESPVSSPTPLVPRIGSRSNLSRSNVDPHPRRLEWEMSVRVQLGSEVDVKKMSVWQLMKLKHTWVSVWFTERTSRLTCVETLTILICMVLGSLGISAPFFHSATDFDASKSIIIAVSTACLTWFVTISLTLLFQNAKTTPHTLAVFGLAFGFCCMCIVLTLVYSYNFELHATDMWVLAFGIACLQDALVFQPFKVLLIALLYGYLPREHWLVTLL